MKLYYVCLAAILQVVSLSSLAVPTPLLLDQQDWLQKPTLLPIHKWQQLPGDPTQQKSMNKTNSFFEWQDIYSWMNTPYFIKGQIQGWFFPSIGEKQPVKNSEPDNQHRGATALTENEENSDSEERPDYEETQDDNPFGLMSRSMMESFMAMPGSDMTSSVREQIHTFTITPDNQTRIDPQSYPNLSGLVETEGRLLLMSGTLPPSLLSDMEEHITSVLAAESTSVAELPPTHRLRRWLRWLRSSSFTYTYKRIYEQDEGNPLNSAMLKRSYYNLDELIALYNLIIDFNLTQEALSDIFKTFLTSVITEEFSLQDDELTLHIMEQPSLLALILLCYHSSVLRVAIESGNIQFDFATFGLRKIANREHFQNLMLAMDKMLTSIITEKRRRDRAVDATIHILNQEPVALHRIQSSYTGGDTPPTVTTNVLETLDRYARNSPLNSSQAAMVVFSLLHMPCIISALNWLESNSLPYNQLIGWISYHHNSLVRHSRSASDIPVLYAALNSIVQSANSGEVISGASQPVPEELSNFVNRWVQGVEGSQPQSSGATSAAPVNPADIEADDFEVLDSTQTTTISLNPPVVLNTLIQMHPDLLMDLNAQLALETEPEKRKKIVKAALEKQANTPFRFVD
ncbi:hypothetical protein NX722_12130 [Endozoicomonas gorgoniicola]|uniref:Uncharacterized protein n=1 Tax=Endozoicomonas gorgoniicola TaxID=1234144 RepID=A0ABT3MVE9_9GAMM|nr:hypothetical protein [Endozoicomonas gorgoniicola]MCW7553366.1 hypothetical protein [Endozoicomonas gorgoniicola]